MDLVELGARSMDLVNLEFLELGRLAGKNGVELFLWIWSCVELSQTHPKTVSLHSVLHLQNEEGGATVHAPTIVAS
jgi:hypothetical protein